MATTKRILSLDVLRGLTVALMIVVNNSGGHDRFSMLAHSAWNGLTPCDLVFPFFLFIMGVSTSISLSRRGTRLDKPLLGKILRRTFLIILVCWCVQWFDHIVYGEFFPFAHLRLTGVLVRIALSYGIVALLASSIGHRHFLWLIPVLLIGYALILLYGNGYANDHSNILYRTDALLLTDNHLYRWAKVDPEGLLGLIPSVAHTMIGYLCGVVFMRMNSDANASRWRFLVRFSSVAVLMIVLAEVLSGILPINKPIWSPTYVLVTCGLAMLVLVVLYLITDMASKTRWTSFFQVFGTNPLALYVLSEIIAIVFDATGFHEWFYGVLTSLIAAPKIASLCYALLYMLLLWLIGLPLWKRHIIIKL